jgi:hypothetical protein
MRRYAQDIRALLIIQSVIVLPLLLIIGCRLVTNAIALRPLAQQLGAAPSQEALVRHVDSLLQTRRGATRAEIHEELRKLGDFTFERYWEHRDGRSQEEAIWNMAVLPFGIAIETVWILHYDPEGHLIDSYPVES